MKHLGILLPDVLIGYWREWTAVDVMDEVCETWSSVSCNQGFEKVTAGKPQCSGGEGGWREMLWGKEEKSGGKGNKNSLPVMMCKFLLHNGPCHPHLFPKALMNVHFQNVKPRPLSHPITTSSWPEALWEPISAPVSLPQAPLHNLGRENQALARVKGLLWDVAEMKL